MKTKKIIIVGGRLTGLYLANILEQLKIPAVLIERDNLTSVAKQNRDGRVSSISYQSSKILEHHKLWQLFEGTYCPIEQIRISDNHSPLFLHFDNEMIDNVPLGFMLENQFVLTKLIKNLQKAKFVEVIDNNSIIEIANLPEKITAKTDSGLMIEGQLLIDASGKFSRLREMANLKSHSYSYGQTAMVFNVSHKENHNNIAQEIFMPSGPFAILPLKDGYSSAIVWTEKSELAEIYLKMSKKEFQLHLSEKFMEYFGKSEVISEVFAYPLSVKFSNEYFKGRLCLLGDSAHSMHPIAGQGFNQTIRDINSLADLLKYHFNLGLDLGSKMLLEDYQTERRFDNHAMIAITDVLNKLFSNNILPLSVTRKLGLAAVNKLPGLQKFFMKYAMGERG